jgi:hypothetical protein
MTVDRRGKRHKRVGARTAPAGSLGSRQVARQLEPPDDPLPAGLRLERKALSRRARRIGIGALAAFIGVFVLLAVTGITRDLPSNLALTIVCVGIIAIVLPLSVATQYLLVVRPLTPALELGAFSVSRARLAWMAFDGVAEIPADADEMLDRLGDNSHGVATFLRVNALILLGDPERARQELDAWKPENALDACRRARLEEQLKFDETGVDGLGGVRPVVAAIQDEQDRKGQFALIALEKARRAAARKEPVLEGLRTARLELGVIELPYLRWLENPQANRARFAVLFVLSVMPAVAVAVLLMQPPQAN